MGKGVVHYVNNVPTISPLLLRPSAPLHKDGSPESEVNVVKDVPHSKELESLRKEIKRLRSEWCPVPFVTSENSSVGRPILPCPHRLPHSVHAAPVVVRLFDLPGQ